MEIYNEKYIRNLVGHIPMHRPVVVLVIYKNNKVLLQKREDNGMWALHGGGMEIGETYLDTLKREMKEELNIEPINPKLLGIFSGKKLYHKYEKSQDEVFVLSHAFICNDYKGEINFSDGEVTNLKWFDIDNLPDNIFHLNKPVLNSLKQYLKYGETVVD
ncbi:MAG: NUDIX domain-containing protein [Clostridia bacterium]|nr:NUDIX domain-containing protein [Clostridia bacterium]